MEAKDTGQLLHRCIINNLFAILHITIAHKHYIFTFEYNKPIDGSNSATRGDIFFARRTKAKNFFTLSL